MFLHPLNMIDYLFCFFFIFSLCLGLLVSFRLTFCFLRKREGERCRWWLMCKTSILSFPMPWDDIWNHFAEDRQIKMSLGTKSRMRHHVLRQPYGTKASDGRFVRGGRRTRAKLGIGFGYNFNRTLG